MKNNKDGENLPEGMADIKSGQIFEVPPEYFEKLPGQLFDRNIQTLSQKKPTSNIKWLPYWMAAASIALVLSITWWYFLDKPTQAENQLSESELNDYIHLELMEYDLEYLTGYLNGEDLYSLLEDDQDNYQQYIEDNIESFDEILY